MTDEELVKRLRDPDEMTCADGMEAADRIEALIEARDTMGHLWAKEAAEKQVALGRIETLTAKLAKAVRTMREAVTTWEQPHYGDMDTAVDHGSEAIDLIRALLAEIEGEKK